MAGREMIPAIGHDGGVARAFCVAAAELLVGVELHLGKAGLSAAFRRPESLSEAVASLRHLADSITARGQGSAASPAGGGERILAQALDIVPLPAFVADPTGRVFSMNEAARRLWGIDISHVQPPYVFGQSYEAWWSATGMPVKPHEWGIARAIASGEASAAEEIVARAADGALRTFLNFAAPVLDARGSVAGAVAVNVDVREGKTTKAELGRRLRQIEAAASIARAALVEEDLQALMDVTVRTVAATLDAELVKILERLADGSGFVLRAGVGWREELIGKPFIGEASQAGYTAAEASSPVIVEDAATETRFPIPAVLTDHGVVSGLSVAIAGAGASPFGVLGAHSRRRRRFTQYDVDFMQSVADTLSAAMKRTAAARELSLRERDFRAMFELAGVGKAQGDPETQRFTRVNRKLCEITGYSEAELLTMRWQDITHPDDRAADLARYRALEGRSDEWTSEKRYVRKDGQIVWVLVSGSMVRDDSGKPLHSLAVVQDVTRRHLAEEAVRRSEERFQQLADSVPPMVWAAGPDGLPTYFNQRWYDLTGLSPEESLSPEGWVALLHPDEAQATLAAWREAVRTGTPYEVEVRYRQPGSGGYRWQLVRGRPVTDESGRVVRWFGTVTDIDDRKRSETAYRTLARNLPGLVYRVLLQDDKRIVFFNDMLTELTGYAEDELRPGEVCSIEPLIVEGDRPRVVAVVRDALEEGRAFEVEYRLVRRDGEVRHFQERGRVILDEAGRPFSIDGVIFDVTERKVAEIALKQAHEEMELRVRERTVELARANEELRRQIREREHIEWMLRQGSERLRVLHDIDRAVLEARSMRNIARVVVTQVRELVPCQRAAVVLVDREADQIEILALSSAHATVLGEAATIPLRDVYMPDDPTDEPQLIPDLRALPSQPAVVRALVEEGLRGHLAVPLIAETRLLGFLTMASTEPGAFDDSVVELARQVAASLTVALHKARLDEELQRRRSELQTLLRRLVEVREDERRTVARELHDDASQALTSLMLDMAALERALAGQESAQRAIAELKRSTEGVMAHLHDLAASLRPPALDRLGLVATLRQALSSLESRSGTRTEFAAVGFEDVRLTAETEAALYHIVQEALTNVVVHARADNVSVVLRRNEEGIVAVVEDDGRGFVPGEPTASNSLGLLGMQEWAAMIGGRVTVESAPGDGTAVYVEVPNGDQDPDR